MDLNINGNPGTGNHYTEVHIGHIENNFPAVKEVTIITGADGKEVITKTEEVESASPSSVADSPDDRQGKRTLIMQYVEKTLPFVKFKWQDKYMELWNDILNLPEVEAVIYDRGRQQSICFNRYALCHLINYVGSKAVDGYGIFEKYNATHIAAAFKDNAEQITRPQLYYQPSLATRQAIDKLLKNKKYVK